MPKISAEKPSQLGELISYNQALMTNFLEFAGKDANSKVTRSGGNYKHTALIYDLIALNGAGKLQLSFTRLGNLGAELGDYVIVFDSNFQYLKPTNCTIANVGENPVIADCLFLTEKPKDGKQVHTYRSVPAPKVEYEVYNAGNLIEHRIPAHDGSILAYRYHYVGNFSFEGDTFRTWFYLQKPINRDGNSRERKPLFERVLKPLFSEVQA